MVSDNQTTGSGWLRYTLVGVLSGAVGSVMTLFFLSGHMGHHQQRSLLVDPPSAETTAEIVEKAQAKITDRMVNAIVEGIKND